MKSNIIDILKSKQIRITPQRSGVLEVLFATSNKHYTAEEIYDKMRKKFPAISLATVYTTLELFKQKGIVKELRIKFNKSTFDIVTERHHHFYCRSCEKYLIFRCRHVWRLKKMKQMGIILKICRDIFMVFVIVVIVMRFDHGRIQRKID